MVQGKIHSFALLVLVGCGQPAPPSPSATATSRPEARQVLLSQDFRSQLPVSARAGASKEKSVELPLGGADDPILRVGMTVLGSQFIESVQVEVQTNPRAHRVQAELGQPINSGSQKVPEMSVPLKVTWSGATAFGKTSRTDLWVLSAARGCVKSTP